MNRIMRNSGAALAAIFIAGSLTACGPGSASSHEVIQILLRSALI